MIIPTYGGNTYPYLVSVTGPVWLKWDHMLKEVEATGNRFPVSLPRTWHAPGLMRAVPGGVAALVSPSYYERGAGGSAGRMEPRGVEPGTRAPSRAAGDSSPVDSTLFSGGLQRARSLVLGEQTSQALPTWGFPSGVFTVEHAIALGSLSTFLEASQPSCCCANVRP